MKQLRRPSFRRARPKVTLGNVPAPAEPTGYAPTKGTESGRCALPRRLARQRWTAPLSRSGLRALRSLLLTDYASFTTLVWDRRVESVCRRGQYGRHRGRIKRNAHLHSGVRLAYGRCRTQSATGELMTGAKARPLFFGCTRVSSEEPAPTSRRNGFEAQRAAIDARGRRRGRTARLGRGALRPTRAPAATTSTETCEKCYGSWPLAEATGLIVARLDAPSPIGCRRRQHN